MTKSRANGRAFDLSLFKRVLQLIAPYRFLFLFTGLLVIALAVLAPLRPYLIQITVDKHVLTGDQPGLVRMTIILLTLLTIESIARYWFNYNANWLGQAAIRDLRFNVFRHINSMRLKYFDSTPIGTMTTRSISDIESISQIFSQGLLTIIGDILQLLAVLFLMFYSDWELTLFSLATFPLLLLATYYFKEGVKKSFQEVRKYIARLNAYLQEHITGMGVVQIFNREKKEFERFDKINKQHLGAHLRGVLYYSIFFPVVEIITATSLGLLVWWGANEVLNYEGSIGMIIAFILYINMFFRPVRMLADKFNTLQMGMVASERVFSVLDTDEKINDFGVLMPEQIEGRIKFNKMSFGYSEEDYVLKDISFTIEPGQKLALVGSTGAGKTSIINVLSRFYEFQKGEVLIDNMDIKTIRLHGLHKHVGFVLQDVFLFSGSILDNIRLKDKSISLERIQEIASYAGIDRFIQKLPGQYDYQVMERGYALSAGQRQLIAFLRAMVYNPKILVLDEATSSIDTETEEILQKATDQLTKNRTSIIIAHRLSTIQNADKILVIDKGRIVEEGNHQELLQQKGAYFDLYKMQFEMINV